MIYHDEA